MRFPIERFSVDNIGLLDFQVRDQANNSILFDWISENGSGQSDKFATVSNPNYIDIYFPEAGDYTVCLSSSDEQSNCDVMLYTEELCTEVSILNTGIRIEENISLCYEDLLEGIIPDVEDNFGNPWQSGLILSLIHI